MRVVLPLLFTLGCGAVGTAPGAATPASASAAGAPRPAIAVYESRASEKITEGDTTLTVEPDAAYRAASDYAHWATIFPSVSRVVITQQDPAKGDDDARVSLIHPDGNQDNVHFHNRPAARVVWFEDTGGRAEVWAEISFAPGGEPGTTRVHSRLFADVKGVSSWFVSDGKVRRLRQQRVREDLASLRAYFARPIATR